MPCIRCGRRGRTVAAHVRLDGDGGTALKPSDDHLLPLCCSLFEIEGCHEYQHRLGERSFYAEIGIDPVAIAAALYAVSGDDAAGAIIVSQTRQRRGYVFPEERDE